MKGRDEGAGLCRCRPVLSPVCLGCSYAAPVSALAPLRLPGCRQRCCCAASSLCPARSRTVPPAGPPRPQRVPLCHRVCQLAHALRHHGGRLPAREPRVAEEGHQLGQVLRHCRRAPCAPDAACTPLPTPACPRLDFSFLLLGAALPPLLCSRTPPALPPCAQGGSCSAAVPFPSWF